jgi:hypothetical protein
MGNNKVLTALVIAHDYPELPAGLIAEGLDKLYRLAKKSQRQAVDYSNGYIDSEEDERLDEKMRLSLDKVNKEYFEGRLAFFQQGDPRGPVPASLSTKPERCCKSIARQSNQIAWAI